MPLCNVCGKQNREQARFCGYCGQPLQGSPSQPAQETRKAPQVVSSARWLVWLVLGPFWFLSTGLGFTVVAIWLTTRSVPERAIFFNKLAYEVGGVGVAVLIGVSLIIAGRLTRAVIMKIRQRRNDLIAAGIMHLLRTNPRAR